MGREFKGYDEYGKAIYLDVETIGLGLDGAVEREIMALLDTIEPEHLAVVAEAKEVTTALCMHCGAPIKRNVLTSTGWAHTSGRSNCLSSSIAITFAEPTRWEVAE